MKKSQDRWGDAHVRLKELFEQRAGMSQQDFAERYGLGTQGMVWQYLSGHRPLNVEAAAKFAKGLGCKISDFAPGMATMLRHDVLPVLGKAASIALFAILLFFALDRSQAADSEGISQEAPPTLCIMLNQVVKALQRFIRGAIYWLKRGLRLKTSVSFA